MTRRLGPEARKTYHSRLRSGFLKKYLAGDAVLDIGYRGETKDAVPITGKAIGVDLDYPGYDGKTLPFPDGSQDAVFASHCLEHVDDFRTVLADWYRVLKVGGYLVIAVPHKYLYERKSGPPSRFNADHKRFYTPASLLAEVEESLPVEGYRVRSLRDNDEGFDYAVEPMQHAEGCYEIELVIEKIARPTYGALTDFSGTARKHLEYFAATLWAAAKARRDGRDADFDYLMRCLKAGPLPPYSLLKSVVPEVAETQALREVLREVVECAPFDEAWYLNRYPDVSKFGDGGPDMPRRHYVDFGYFEGRPAWPHLSLYE